MKNDSRRVFLFSEFSFIRSIPLIIKNRESFFYWDPFSDQNSIETLLMLRIFGRMKGSKYINYLLSLFFGAKLRIVPHGDKVNEYHRIQILSENHTTKLLSKCLEDELNLDPSKLKGFKFLNDIECEKSAYLKNMGFILGPLVENIMSLRESGVNQFTIISRINLTSSVIYDELERQFGCFFLRTKQGHRIIFRLYNYCIIFLKSLFLLIRKFRRVHTSYKKNYEKFLATELVDPSFLGAGPTEPFAFTSFGLKRDNIVTYIRSEQEKKTKVTSAKLKVSNIISLRRLPPKLGEIKKWIYASLLLINYAIKNGWGLIVLLREQKNLNHFFEFNIFLRHFRPKNHIYYAIPNGQVSTRYDSGWVTSACRHNNCKSIGHQSRVMYRHKFYYYFEALDTMIYWGHIWKKTYDNYQFFKETEIIPIAKNSFIPKVRKDKHKNINLVIFTADIDIHNPLHYTLSYTEEFLKEAFCSIINYQNISSSGVNIILKLKSENHLEILKRSGKLEEYFSNENLKFTIDSKKHKIENVLEDCDIVFAIGFTTPLIDAISRGIPAIYYTKYNGIYNEIFDKKLSGLVKKSSQELLEFLISEGKDLNIEYDNLLGIDEISDKKFSLNFGNIK